MSAALVLIFNNKLFVCVFRGDGAVTNVSAPNTVFTSLFNSIATEATNFGAMSATTLAPRDGLLAVILVFVKKDPNSATNKVGAAAVTIVVVCVISCLEKDGNYGIFNEGVDDRMVGGTKVILVVGLILKLATIVTVLTASGVGVSSMLFRMCSTVDAINVAANVAESLGAMKHVVVVVVVCYKEVKDVAFILSFIREPSGTGVRLPRRGIVVKWKRAR